MTELKSSEAQRRASKKYDQKNKDSKQYRNKNQLRKVSFLLQQTKTLPSFKVG
ncbi:hypothetical protein GQR36_26870 [Enterococcus termitis]